jgi:hypothetical protein
MARKPEPRRIATTSRKVPLASFRTEQADFLSPLPFSVKGRLAQRGISLPSLLCHSDPLQKSLDKRYTHVPTSPMLARQIIPPPPRPVKLNPLLLYSCKLLAPSKNVNCCQISDFQTLFAKHPGSGWVPRPLEAATSALLATKPAKHAFVTPLFATLTHSYSCKSFACHSYENTRDGGANGAVSDAFPLLQFAPSVGGSWR